MFDIHIGLTFQSSKSAGSSPPDTTTVRFAVDGVILLKAVNIERYKPWPFLELSLRERRAQPYCLMDDNVFVRVLVV